MGKLLQKKKAIAVGDSTINSAAALKQLRKANVSEIQLEALPMEFCVGENIDLSKWTILVTDAALCSLCNQPTSFFQMDTSSREIAPIVTNFKDRRSFVRGLIDLNIAGAKSVTNYGIAVIARGNPSLRALNISGCAKISDAAIQEVGLNCPNLTALNISFCNDIEGKGLKVISECCKLLQKIDISGCRSLKNWSLMKIFFECDKLEDVNVSSVSNVGDEELRVLAQNSPNLLILNAQDCQYVSDQTVLAISQHCPEIDVLNIGKTQMAFRITDVSLLAVGQRCPSIRIICLKGCEQVTDVGLNWLALGCKALEEIDISNCLKITDAGLRSIGSGCHMLISLDLSNDRLVSDVGLASVASGCKTLKKLACQGLYLLSDPRTTVAPKKGQKIQAWEAVIGIAALDKFCPLIENINLSGCIRLNIAVSNHLARLVNIVRINLSGCSQMEANSLVALAEGCIHIEELNLSDCVLAVTNVSVAAFARRCRSLKVITLARCDRITASATTALATLERLDKIDISGCVQIDDDCILPICDGSRLLSLRYLSLVGTAVTDSSLAWLGARTGHNLILIALKGTRVSKHGVRAIRHSFPYSDVLENENFFGFWPKNRAEDRKLMNQYYLFLSGMVKIQAMQRSHLTRLKVMKIANELKIFRAATTIQCAARIFISRATRERLLKEKRSLLLASAKIASIFAVVRAQAKLRLLKRQRMMRIKHARATVIQAYWRRYLVRDVLPSLIEEQIAYEKHCIDCVICIQSFLRGYFGRQRVERIRHMIRTRDRIILVNSERIQRAFRGYMGRSRVWHIRDAIARHKAREALCRRVIHRFFRLSHFIRCVQRYSARRKRRNRKALKIQCLVRRWIACMYRQDLMIERDRNRRAWCILWIQKSWRKRWAIILLRRLRKEREFLAELRARAVQTLAKYLIGMIARRRCRQLRIEYIDYIRRQAELRVKSVIKIQALFRGNKGRFLFDIALREKKGKWKELFDENKQKRFFYNKLTGEVRWKMPQDLLDLIPKLKCDNCEFYEGSVECLACSEVFCQQCFEQVHFGGRRKGHEFRALFDYYGKRIDYGETEYPSKWPTEIVQDEVQGWMLRVAPIREPLVTFGDWEQYSEVDTAGQSSGKAFYFNRKTFETTYEPPEEFALTEYQDESNAAYNDADLLATENAKYFGSTDYGGYDYGSPQSKYVPHPDPYTYTAAAPDVLLSESQGYYSAAGEWIAEVEMPEYANALLLNGTASRGGGGVNGGASASVSSDLSGTGGLNTRNTKNNGPPRELRRTHRINPTFFFPSEEAGGTAGGEGGESSSTANLFNESGAFASGDVVGAKQRKRAVTIAER